MLHERGSCLRWHIKYGELFLVPEFLLVRSALFNLHAITPVCLVWIPLAVLSMQFKIPSVSEVA